MKNKILYIICAIMIFVSIYEITNSYGLFESETDRTVDSNIVGWNIKINNDNINTTQDFVINNFTVVDNDMVTDNKLAPGAEGYFDINIDPSGTDVSIVYDLTFDFTDVLDKFSISRIEETTGGGFVKTGENTYSNIIRLSDIKNNVTNNVRVYLKWDNNELNNETDTQIGLTKDNLINIPVSITISQYLNEELVPYTEPVE